MYNEDGYGIMYLSRKTSGANYKNGDNNMKLIFIRHGDPDYVNDTLTEKGRREAELLADMVSKWDVKQFYCSPLGRAKDTAAYSLKKMGREATIYPWLK